MIEQILIFTAGSGLLLGLLGFVARSVFKHYLDKDLESFKADIKSEADKRHFVFQRLYEKRLEIISGLYEKSVEAGRAARYAVQMQGNIKEEDVPALERQVKDFKERYEIARLWIDEKCCETIDKLLDQHSVFYKVVNAANLEKSGLGKDWIGRKYLELWQQADEELPTAQEMLRRQFQATMKNIEP